MNLGLAKARCEEQTSTVDSEDHLETGTAKVNLSAAAATTAAEEDRHNQILDIISQNQLKNEAAAAVATAKIAQDVADAKATAAATEEALLTIMTTTWSATDDRRNDRSRQFTNFNRQQQDTNTTRTILQPPQRTIQRNPHDELTYQSRLIDQNNVHSTTINTHRDESPPQCPPCFPQGRNEFGQIPLVPKSSARTNTPPPRSAAPLAPRWNPERHQYEIAPSADRDAEIRQSQQTTVAFASQLLDDKAAGKTAKASKYVNFIKDHYKKGDINDEDVQMQIQGTAYVVRQLQREDPTPEQEGILGKCWPFILAWYDKYDKNGIKYKTCGGKPPDGMCKMDHTNPESYNEIHLRYMMMALDEARSKRQKADNKTTQEQAATGDGEEWWKHCNYCGKDGHTTRTCDDNPYWNSRCSTCHMLGHINTECRSSDATIARGLARKERDDANGDVAPDQY